MNVTRVLLQHRQPLIRFIGKHGPPAKLDHTPHPHPMSPTHSLPDTFSSYRQKAQQHGPLNRSFSSTAGGAIGGHAGRELGSVKPDKGEVFDRSELPARFGRMTWTQAEIEAVESGGASLYA